VTRRAERAWSPPRTHDVDDVVVAAERIHKPLRGESWHGQYVSQRRHSVTSPMRRRVARRAVKMLELGIWILLPSLVGCGSETPVARAAVCSRYADAVAIAVGATTDEDRRHSMLTAAHACLSRAVSDRVIECAIQRRPSGEFGDCIELE